MKKSLNRVLVVFLGMLMLLATVQGSLAFSWWGLFPDKASVPSVQYSPVPVTLLGRLNNFFLQHQEFRSLPEGTSIELAMIGSDPPLNNYFLITEKGITQTKYNDKAADANIWVMQPFLEKVLATDNLCQFLGGLVHSPEDGTSYGVSEMRNVFVLRWKFGGGDRYCPGVGLWP